MTSPTARQQLQSLSEQLSSLQSANRDTTAAVAAELEDGVKLLETLSADGPTSVDRAEGIRAATQRLRASLERSARVLGEVASKEGDTTRIIKAALNTAAGDDPAPEENRTPRGPSSRKVTVNLPEDAIELLRRLAEERSTTMTEVLKSAIKTEGFIDKTTAEGSKVLVQAPDKTLRQLVFR
jgi:hypothetical protein